MLTTFPIIQFNLQTHRNTYDEISNDSMFIHITSALTVI